MARKHSAKGGSGDLPASQADGSRSLAAADGKLTDEIVDLLQRGICPRQVARHLGVGFDRVMKLLRAEADAMRDVEAQRYASLLHYENIKGQLAEIINWTPGEDTGLLEIVGRTEAKIKAARPAIMAQQSIDKLMGLPVDPTFHLNLTGGMTVMIQPASQVPFQAFMKDIPAAEPVKPVVIEEDGDDGYRQ